MMQCFLIPWLIVSEKNPVGTDTLASLTSELLPAVVCTPFCLHNFCFKIESEYSLVEDILEGSQVQHM